LDTTVPTEQAVREAINSATGTTVADIGSTAETVGGSVANGTAVTASRSDHKHAITNPKLDSLATPDATTTLDSNTTQHGLLLQAVAPASGLMNFVGITNGETVYLNKPLFDTTNPAANGAASPGTQLIAARRDHVHPSAGIIPTFVDREVPSGTMNGVNTTFGIGFNPAGSEMLYLNGMLLNQGAGNDYTIATNVITMLVVPAATDILLVSYRH
jgi:hypothetical protein